MKNKKKKIKVKAPGNGLHRGIIEITRSGMGYVTVDNLQKDVMVKPQHFGCALHGDTVEVEIVKQSSSGKTEGVIRRVLHRKQLTFIGHVAIHKQQAFFIAQSERPMPDFSIPLEALNRASHQQKVIARLSKWEPKMKMPEGIIVELITADAENDLAMKQILMQSGFTLQFSPEQLEESLRLSDRITEEAIAKRKDFRKTLTFTIDPVDAKDFDDALSIQFLPDGTYEVGVHIADVSHFITPGSLLDEEAYFRATSVYLPDRVLPMLPEKISNELCSLRPHEDKYTFSAVFTMTKDAEVKSVWLGKTLIHSDHRFTYEEVQDIIESGAGLYRDEILLLNQMAQQLRSERFQKGAINFSSQEVRFVLDDKQVPVGIMVKESKAAHQLIEEFMLLANKQVALYIGGLQVNNKPIPFPYRVHDTPDEAKLGIFSAFARKYGHTFDTSSPEKIAASFNQMLRDVKGKPEQHVLETLGIRTMAKAVYTANNTGHYGLGFKHYCHFTSPIRRYPDVLVHRILEQCLNGTLKVDKKMEQQCKHCSERERAAMESERAANKYKQVEYMRQFVGETFEGVISGVAAFGFWVETVEHKCEGLVSLLSISHVDDFIFVEEDYRLTGKRSGRSFRIGDPVSILVVAANLEKRQLDYEWVPDRKK
ncbi:MAG: ribonuclease R [Bacteroidetes bacterium]|nr:ribonuclease R [Bacteroidota bacterium]